MNSVDNRRMCPNCRAFVTTNDRVCPYCDMRLGQRAIDLRNPGGILGGLIPHAHFTTVIILLVNAGLYIAGTLNPDLHLTFLGSSLPARYMQGQWWRLITAGFLHGDIWHILFNSYALFIVGSEVEQFYGTSRLIVFYFLTTVTGFWASSHLGSYPSVGSSAGIFGLMGAMLAFGVTDRSRVGAMVKSYYLQWLIFGLLMSFTGRVDLWAHVGGLAGGFVAGCLASPPRARLMWREPLMRALAGVSIAITLLAFGMLYRAITQA